MLIYTTSGERDFGVDPVEVKQRGGWEFCALLAGSITLDFGERESKRTFAQPTLCAFPPDFRFGVGGQGTCARAVFDFSMVPAELEQMIPPCGYYCTPLSKADCQQISAAADVADATLSDPTRLIALKQQGVVTTLSLLALRDVREEPLTGSLMALAKTEQALKWYESMMHEGMNLQEVCRVVHVSPAHLRRLFHEVRDESPKAALTRVRMKRVETLLTRTSLPLEEIAARVGLADASALSRAVKTYFGKSPCHLRKNPTSQPPGMTDSCTSLSH